MFECAKQMLIQFFSFIPTIIGLWLLFDLTGSLLFNKR